MTPRPSFIPSQKHHPAQSWLLIIEQREAPVSGLFHWSATKSNRDGPQSALLRQEGVKAQLKVTDRSQTHQQKPHMPVWCLLSDLNTDVDLLQHATTSSLLKINLFKQLCSGYSQREQTDVYVFTEDWKSPINTNKRRGSSYTELWYPVRFFMNGLVE